MVRIHNFTKPIHINNWIRHMSVVYPNFCLPNLGAVQDRCVGGKEVPLHKLLKAEIYSLLHATDCSKVAHRVTTFIQCTVSV